MNEGTALVMERNGVELGVYDEGNLTGGVCISKINDDTGNPIYSSRVDLSGYVTTTMMESAFQDIQQATIGQLTVPSSGYFTFKGHNVSWKSATVDGTTINYMGY